MSAVMKRIHPRAWTDEENGVLYDWYGRGLAYVQTMLPNRTGDAIRKQALFLGLTNQYSADDCDVPLPAMDLNEQLACLRFRKWTGPVDRTRALTWSLK